MNAAKQFMKQLQEGNTTEAIKTITTSLQERTVDLIGEKKIEILESYGFIVKEAEEADDDSEEDEDEEDKEEETKSKDV